MSTIVTNKLALHEYAVLEKLEAGIVLSGAEVKSVRGGNVNLKGSYAALSKGELWLINAHIAPYTRARIDLGYDPTRSRKLLIQKKQRNRIIGLLHTRGLTLVPLSVYTAKSRLKIELAVCRGKKRYEKRELLKKRAVDREIRSALKR